jgi:hypothetical protein
VASPPLEKPALLPGLAMLDALRPPEGWSTDVALGTTYSLELPVALAAMVSLAGTARDTSDYGLHSAVRALHTLSDRVRIVAQQGRIEAPSRHSCLVHLLDGIVRPVAWDERDRSFHPKTWVVRWTHETPSVPARWALLVGSRNLTSSQDWDLGVVLTGDEGGEGQRLPEVERYVTWLLDETREPSFGASAWATLPSVRWRGPKLDVDFGFHGPSPLAWKDTALTRLGRDGARRVLLLSPFLDATALEVAERALPVTRAWDDVPRRFVAGRPDLEAVARTAKGAAALGRLDVRCLAPSQHGVCAAAANAGEAGDDDEPDATDFGLHAKAAVVWHGKNDVSLVIGSANLSQRGWTGRNAEAWVKLRGRTDAAEALWAWSRRAASFDLSAVEPETPEEIVRRALETARDELRATLATTSFALDETMKPPRLRAPAALLLELPPSAPAVDAATLAVARLGAVDPPVSWPSGACDVALAECRPAERTALVVLRITVTSGTERLEDAWVQSVAVTPSIGAARNDEAIAEALGPRQFMAFLTGLLDPGHDDGSGDPSETSAEGGASDATLRGDDRVLSLERLFRGYARRDPARLDALHAQLDRAIASYRRARGASEDGALAELWQAWDAIQEGLQGP